MKKLFALLLILFSLFCISATNQIGGVTDPDSIGGVPNESTSTVGGVTFTSSVSCAHLYCNGFEATGVESGWTETKTGDSTIEWDQTTGELVGAQSIDLDSNTSNCNTYYNLGSSYDTLYAFVRVKFVNLSDHAADTSFVIIATGTGGAIGKLMIDSSENWKVVHGTAGTAAGSGPSGGTEYYLWFETTENSGGSNGVVRLYFGTTGTKSSATMIEQTAGNDTDQNPQRIFLLSYNGDQILFDGLILSDSPIGDQ